MIGGLAVIAHGVQRFTNDLDICPSPDRDNLARLATALQEADARQLGLGPVLARDAVEGVAFGIPLRVCSLERLRQMKRAPDRPQDRQDPADLEVADPDGDE